MKRATTSLISAMAAVALLPALHAQFNILGKSVDIHGFASEGFAYTNDNNYLTMNTSSGSGFTDGGLNVSSQITDKFRVGAQVYIRDIGHLGQWHPELDWAVADYRFKDWFGIRGGKVKSALGLYNDTQDMEFLQTWALLPQSVYPLDVRSTTIAHIGADVYGNVSVKKAGSFSYTVYGGKRPTDLHGGVFYGLLGSGIYLDSYGGTTEGADTRWNTPVKGLMLGASYAILDISEIGTRLSNKVPYTVDTNKDHTPVFYGEYNLGKLRLNGEYRREIQDVHKTGVNKVNVQDTGVDIRSGFLSAAYRVTKWLEVGTYHSRYYPNWHVIRGLPANHLFDQTVTARIDFKNNWDLKIEEHFMNGTTGPNSYHGFYTLDNEQGEMPNTRLFVMRLGFHI